MKIAIPLADGRLCMHFGHCEQFALVEVDDENKTILATDYRTPPAHEPGVLPRWLHEQGANVIIAGGGLAGVAARALFGRYELTTASTGNLGLSVGIAGAVQHMVGLRDAKVIVAINSDEDAPIFEVADIALVAESSGKDDDWLQHAPIQPVPRQ